MRKLAIFGAVLLAACTPDAPPAHVSATPASCGLAAGTVLDEKALYAAEAAYNVPAQAYVAADSRGALSASVKAKLKPIMVRAYDALKLARSTFNAGDVCGFQAQSQAVLGLAAQASALLK